MKKKPPFILHLLFTIYAWIVGLFFLFYFFFIGFPLSILRGYNNNYPLLRKLIQVFAFFFSPIRISYHPDFDPKAPYLLVQNHVNILDAFLAAKISPNAICGIMHKWQFSIPVYGWLMSMSKGIPVDPKRIDNFERMSQIAAQRKDEGYSIISFPEGGRSLNGSLKPFKKGIFLTAQKSGYPIVPIATKGNFYINRKGSYMMWPHPIEVQVGKPRIMPQDLTRVEFEKFIADIRNEMDASIQNHE